MTRQGRYLRQRYCAIIGYTSFAWVIIGLLIMLPVVAVLLYGEQQQAAWGFFFPGLVLFLTGLGLWRRLAPVVSDSLTLTEGAVIVVLIWSTAFLAGAVPLILVEGLTFTQALFESTSGWTTTGLSVVDPRDASRGTLLYRSLMQLAGGAGFAIITLSLLVGPAGAGLAGAEGRSEQLEPHVRRSAILVLRIYLIYVLAGVVGLYLAGMSLFDAVNHAFAGLSTGGFSTQADSIGHWNSPLVEGVTIFLMLLGTTNFLTIYALMRGDVRVVVRHAEFHLMGLLLIIVVPLLLLSVTLALYSSFSVSVRVAIFEAVSALSTTGFSTVGYSNWPGVGWLILLILMLVGGGGGSTAGGMKQVRVYILLKSIFWEFRRALGPSRIINQPAIGQGERRQYLHDRDVRQVAAVVFLHLIALALVSLIMAAHGYPLQDSLFEAASTLSTVGLSIGLTAADAPPLVLWTQIMAMFLGRLEYIAVVVGLVKLATDIRNGLLGRTSGA